MPDRLGPSSHKSKATATGSRSSSADPRRKRRKAPSRGKSFDQNLGSPAAALYLQRQRQLLQAAQFATEEAVVLTALNVTVQVLQAQELAAKNQGWTYASSDPLVVVQVLTGGKQGKRVIEVGKTKVVKDTVNPIWGGTSNVFQTTLKGRDLGVKQSEGDDEEEPIQLRLQLSIYNGDNNDKDHLMGIVTIDLDTQKAMDQNGEWFLIPASSAKDATGRLQLSLQTKLHFSNDTVDEPSSGRKLGSSVATALRASATAFDAAKDAPPIPLDSTHTTEARPAAPAHTSGGDSSDLKKAMATPGRKLKKTLSMANLMGTAEARRAAPSHSRSSGSKGLKKIMATPGRTLKKTLSMANMAGMAAIQTLSFDDQEVAAQEAATQEAAAPKAAPQLSRSMSSSALQQPATERPSSRHGKFASKNYVAASFRFATKDAAAFLATPKRAASKSMKAGKGMMKGLMNIALDDTQHSDKNTTTQLEPEETKASEEELEKESEHAAAGTAERPKSVAPEPLSSDDTKPTTETLHHHRRFKKGQSKDMSAFCTPKRTASKTLKVKTKGIVPGGLALDDTNHSDKGVTTEAKSMEADAEKDLEQNPETKPPKEAPSRISRPKARSKEPRARSKDSAFCTPKRTTSKTLKVKTEGIVQGGLALDDTNHSDKGVTTEAKSMEADAEKDLEQNPETKPPKEAPSRISRPKARSKEPRARSKDSAFCTPKRTTSKTLKVKTEGIVPGGLALDDTNHSDKGVTTEAKSMEADAEKDLEQNPETKPPKEAPSRISRPKARSKEPRARSKDSAFCTPKRTTSKTLKVKTEGIVPGGLALDDTNHSDKGGTTNAKPLEGDPEKDLEPSPETKPPKEAPSRISRPRARSKDTSAFCTPKRTTSKTLKVKTKESMPGGLALDGQPHPDGAATAVATERKTPKKSSSPKGSSRAHRSPLQKSPSSATAHSTSSKSSRRSKSKQLRKPKPAPDVTKVTLASESMEKKEMSVSDHVNRVSPLTIATSSSSDDDDDKHNDGKRTWTCCCGQEVDIAGKFCGMCGTKKHWTCSGCASEANGCLFKFCMMCGTSKDATAPNTTGSSNQNGISCR